MPQAVDLVLDRLLRLVLVLGAGVDPQLGHHLAAERVARQHAPHGVEDDVLGVLLAQLVGGGRSSGRPGAGVCL